MWFSTERGRLSFQEWADDELAVAYDSLTGDTHLIACSAIEILELIEIEPSTVKCLAEQLAGRFSTGDEAQIEEFIAATLLQLRDLGFVTHNPV